MQVTRYKHLPFDAGKNAYFDRLRLQNSLREISEMRSFKSNENILNVHKKEGGSYYVEGVGPGLVDSFDNPNKIFKLSKHNCFVTCVKTLFK